MSTHTQSSAVRTLTIDELLQVSGGGTGQAPEIIMHNPPDDLVGRVMHNPPGCLTSTAVPPDPYFR